MLEKIKEKWDDILLKIKEDHDITDVSYKTWLLPLKPYSVDKDILLQYYSHDNLPHVVFPYPYLDNH